MIAIAADHGGFALKEEIKKHLDSQNIEYKDFGTYSTESCDYPLMAKAACLSVVSGECEKAKYTRLHNDANALCLGGRVVGVGLAVELVDVFLHTEFEGGRHQRRIQQIADLEK